jgi:hypothetical protein
LKSPNGDGPYAVKTAFGWTVAGPSGSKASRYFKSATSFIVRNSKKELTAALENMYKTDFVEHFIHAPRSQEDFNFIEIAEDEARLVDGHQELPLPIRDVEKLQLPNNFAEAQRYATSLRKRLQRPENSALKRNNVETMNNSLQTATRTE